MPEGAVQFGISLVPATERLDRTRELVRVADEAGLDLVGIQDHPYQRHFLDTWALIPALLGETERISLFTDVANLPLRPPAMMAKAAASLDVLSGGRFELGLGAGAFGDVVANFGGPRRTPGESVEAVDEAIDVIKLLWSEERSVSFEGKHYRLEDARPGPRPAHPIGQRADRRRGREGGPRPRLDPAHPEPAGTDRRRARTLPLRAACRLPGRRATRRTGRLVGRDTRGIHRGRLRHAHPLAGGRDARAGRAARPRGRPAAGRLVLAALDGVHTAQQVG